MTCQRFRDDLRDRRAAAPIASRMEFELEQSPQVVWVFKCPCCGKTHSLEPKFDIYEIG